MFAADRQRARVDQLRRSGWHIVIWENDRVCMAHVAGQFAEVWPDGRVTYVEQSK